MVAGHLTPAVRANGFKDPTGGYYTAPGYFASNLSYGCHTNPFVTRTKRGFALAVVMKPENGEIITGSQISTNVNYFTCVREISHLAATGIQSGEECDDAK